MGKCPVASHYAAAAGREYYAYQSADNEVKHLETWKFQPYIRSTDTVVDYGCGAGFLLKSLDAMSKLGIEVNPAAREEASRRGIPTVGAAPGELPAAFADVVISNHALEHTRSGPSTSSRRCTAFSGPPVDWWYARRSTTGD